MTDETPNYHGEIRPYGTLRGTDADESRVSEHTKGVVDAFMTLLLDARKEVDEDVVCWDVLEQLAAFLCRGVGKHLVVDTVREAIVASHNNPRTYGPVIGEPMTLEDADDVIRARLRVPVGSPVYDG